MTRISFHAPEYFADQSFHDAEYEFDGSEESGWAIRRNGAPHMELGPGYRLLRTEICGVCSTDLARHFLPFPLPQVTGHELVARAQAGSNDPARYVVEINASHFARGIDSTDCPYCNAGLHKHCPDRLVLGIHDLPGGFGPWILAPSRAIHRIPESLPSETAVLIEPFAAALNAVDTVAPREGDRVAVLGPRRLGMLVVVALAARRRETGREFDIVALSRHDELLRLAEELGATHSARVDGDGAPLAPESFDVVIDTTGNPDALATAVRLAAREVHVKSTHGQPSCGLTELTALVVDELALERLPDTPTAERVAWLARAELGAPPPALGNVETAPTAAIALERFAGPNASIPAGALPRADAAVVANAEQVDRAIRPLADDETSLVRPCGRIWIHPRADTGGSPLLEAIVRRDLRLSSSRCGDFETALALLAGDAELRDLGDRFVTHRLSASSIADAFRAARSEACIKAVLAHA